MHLSQRVFKGKHVNARLQKDIVHYGTLLDVARQEISKAVVGQIDVLNGLILGILCNGHVLLEGVPGIAKTLIVRTLAQATGGQFSRIQFTADLLPTDITGLTIYEEKLREFKVVKGPVFANYLLADEINRSPPKCVLGDTPIITSEGELESARDLIQKYEGEIALQEGDEYWIKPKTSLKLLSFDLEDYKIKPEEVKYLYKQKTTQPYYIVTLKSGRII